MILIIISFFIMPEVMADTTYIKGIMTDKDGVGLRPTNTDYSGRMKDDEGENISLSWPETFEILGEDSTYYKINVQYKGFYYIGYVPKEYSTKVGTYTVSDSTVQEMRNLGFDDTYAYKLAILKTINPSWTFVPIKNIPSWSTVINGETSYVKKNLISGFNTNLRSTVDDAYRNGTWTEYESGWYAASAQTVRYYMDPRNFLNEGHVFMFEQLDFKESIHTDTVINTAINNNSISTYPGAFKCNNLSAPCDSKTSISYSSAFLEAGKTHNINPIHMVARVHQEQGWDFGTKVIGNNTNFPGYFNFFNINAYAKADKSALTRALEYATSEDWNSPYATINGGADFLYNKYTKPEIGQDTNYFQKFNVINSSNYYGNQYMQNTRAPYSESYTTYSNYYKSGVMNSDFVFKIPVYEGMPAFTSLSAEGNEDATLKSLNIPGCYLMPTFTPSALNYNCSVNKDVASVNVSAVATNANASVSGTGVINLASDTNSINVIVTAATGNTRTYNISIKKVETSEFTPDEIISKVGININSGFLSGSNIVTSPNDLITLIKNNFSTATVSLNNPKKIGTGTKLTITNNGSKTYNLLIYGDNNGDGTIDILDLLKVQKHLLKSAKLIDVYLKSSDTNKDGTVDILDLLTIQKHILGTGNISQ